MIPGSNKIKTTVFIALLLVLVFHPKHLWIGPISSDSRITDFISYWASGQLLMNGEDPYSAENILPVQQSVGWTKDEPLVMYNPPCILAFILPFCIGDYSISKLMWLIMLLATLFICNHVLWTFYNGLKENRVLSLIAFGSFSPVYFMISKGQIVPLILAGLVGFLHHNRKNRWWLAASFTIFLMIKPQLTYLFCISLLLWIIHVKNWKFLMEIALINLIFMSIPLLFRVHTYMDYGAHMTSSSSAYLWATPVLGTHLRLLFGGENHWLQFLPMVVSIIWMVYYFNKKKHDWDWSQELPIILFVSLISTSYSWVNDYALMLIAIAQAAAWIADCETSCRKQVLVGYVAVNIIFFIQYLMSTSEHLLVWYVPALFALYLFLKKNVKQTIKIAAGPT